MSSDIVLDTKFSAERLVLGTAQLGMDYGIANTSGQPDLNTAEAIIKRAWEAGIREFDTARAYGTSEHVLGRTLSSLGLSNDAFITTKLAPDIDHLSKKAVFQSVQHSLKALGVSKILCLMVHQEQLIHQWNKGIGRIMRELMDSQLVERVGISVYSPDAALQALENDRISTIQIPSNIFDRRFEDAGVFLIAEHRGIQIYVRSVFLQGLLLLDPEDLPSHLSFASQILEKYKALCEENRTTKIQIALGYVKMAYPNAKIILGMETIDQIEKNLQTWKNKLSKKILRDIQKFFVDIDIRILNPSLWQ